MFFKYFLNFYKEQSKSIFVLAIILFNFNIFENEFIRDVRFPIEMKLIREKKTVQYKHVNVTIIVVVKNNEKTAYLLCKTDVSTLFMYSLFVRNVYVI